MTVKELIDILDRLDPEAHVFVKGYEGGLDYAGLKGPVTDIALNVHIAWWYGKHDYADIKYNESKYKIVKGIVL